MFFMYIALLVSIIVVIRGVQTEGLVLKSNTTLNNIDAHAMVIKLNTINM